MGNDVNMRTPMYNEGACGIEQILYLGRIDFTTPSGTAKKLTNQLPDGVKITRLVVDVRTAFNAATTNTISVGTKDNSEEYAAVSDVTPGTAKQYIVHKFADVSENDVYATYTQTGTAATAGVAEIWAYVAKVEV